MKAILICPSDRSEVADLTIANPLCLLPLFGLTVIDFWLQHLASRGVKDVVILAADRPEMTRNHVQDGARWGLAVQVHPLSEEPTLEETRKRWVSSQTEEKVEILVVDHLPHQPPGSLFKSAADFFKQSLAYLPSTLTPDRIGLRERSPGVFVGLRTRIHPTAHIMAPAWIGDEVHIEANAVVGPGAILEPRVFVDRGAEVIESQIAPDTYVGREMEVRHALVAGSWLYNWSAQFGTVIPDAFMLCSLSRRADLHQKSSGWIGRLIALIALVFTLPIVLVALMRLKWKGQSLWVKRRAVGRSSDPNLRSSVLTYFEIPHEMRFIRRWPQLWNVACGSFCWVGNRPITPGEASLLKTDFERLWLTSPIGWISLGDAYAIDGVDSDEAKAHASYYAVQAGGRMDRWILRRALRILLSSDQATSVAADYSLNFKTNVVETNH